MSVSKDHRFAPILQRLLWLWRPIREWQSLSHFEHVKGVVGPLARHAVFLWSLFFSAFTRCISSYCDNPTFTVRLQASLSVAVTSQGSVFIQVPRGLACIRPWSVVGITLLVFSLLPVHHIKGLLKCGHLSSVSHVLAIARAFALRECISLVSQPFPAQLYLS